MPDISSWLIFQYHWPDDYHVFNLASILSMERRFIRSVVSYLQPDSLTPIFSLHFDGLSNFSLVNSK